MLVEVEDVDTDGVVDDGERMGDRMEWERRPSRKESYSVHSYSYHPNT